MTDIVGVHGIAQQQLGRNQLINAWAPALRDGVELSARRQLAAPPLDLAFYGDLFLSRGTEDSKGTTSDIDFGVRLLEGIGKGEAEALRGLAAETVTDEDMAAVAEAPPDKSIGRVPLPLQGLIGVLDRRFGRRGAGVLLLGELRQVRRYLLDHELKAAVDARTRGAARGCRVLVGHSLGSVVAFEYVRQNPDHQLDLLLTLGSPLGLRLIRELLLDGDLGGIPTEKPSSTTTWVNVRDRRDPVAAAGPLDAHWPGIDEVVVDNEKSAHSVERYLSKAKVGAAICAAMPELAQ